MKVLVTDGLFRKSLAAVRCLSQQGFSVIAGARTHLSPALWSRHARASLVYPDPLLKPARFVDAIGAYARRYGVRVLLPMEETTLLTLLRNRNRLPECCALYGPDPGVIENLSDKLFAARLLADAGFPVPVTSTDADEVPLPAVVKPRRKSGAAGVVFVHDRDAARNSLRAVRARYGDALVQEYVPGSGVGVSLLIQREGGVVAAFAHRRIRERPSTGGASTSRVAIPLPDGWEALGACLNGAGFFGPVHVEFRRSERDGSLRPIEINPRYWGSLALAVAAGVPFPALHARLALGETPEAVLSYAVGTRCRWFLFGEVLSGIGALRRGRFREAFAALRPGGPFDILSSVDPGPAAARMLSPAAWLGSPGLRLLLRRGSTSENVAPEKDS